MSQSERMRSADNEWEADPWDASNSIADYQLAGFKKRTLLLIKWKSVRDNGPTVFGIEATKLSSQDVEFVAVHAGEEMLLMQSMFHGFPDPPEWRLATRMANQFSQPWQSWGYFRTIPEAWQMPE